jgi:hypothetical protein
MRRGYKQTVLALTCAAALLACASADAQVRRAKGWVREPAHVVATIPLILRFRDYLPEEVDLSAKFPTPGNQGQQSSCTAWATGYAMRSYYEGRRRNWDLTSPDQIISPGYIYNRLHDYRGSCDVGTPISDALELLKTAGAPTLSAYPYLENDCSRPANAEQVRRGTEFRINGWSGIDSKKPDDAKGQLARGNPVVFGMDVSDSFENLSGPGIYDDVASARTGGHAMVLVGYSERRQAFKVMNSWGTGWGEGGFAWVSYRAIRQLSDLMFVMDVPEYVAPVPPRPAPSPVVILPPKPAPEPIVVPKPSPPPAPVIVTPPVPAPPAPEPIVTPKPLPPPAPVVVTPPTPYPPAPHPVVTPGPMPPAPPVVVAPPAPKPVPQPKPVIAPPLATVRMQVQARLRELACARVEGQIDASRMLQLRGFAGSMDDLAKLQTELKAMPGVRGVESNVSVYPWPQCEVFLNFADALKQKRGLGARLRGASAGVFTEGDSMSIEVVTPAYPSYLYVTYLQTNGEATNLYWPQGRFPKALAPNTRITFGGDLGGEPVYRVAPPFGNEIVVVVASASPLFQEELPETATDREYLTSFRKSFLVQPKGGGGQRMVSAFAVPLRTKARQ